MKVQTQKDLESLNDRPFCIMAHGIEVYKQAWFQTVFEPIKYSGASVYTPPEHHNVYGGSIIQLPYSLYDRRFEQDLESIHDVSEIHVRSVFLRGRILEKVLPHDCISFCLMNPYVDRVIIGVDSLEQLKKNLETFVMFESLKTDDEEIIDPRKWKADK